jgi:hypothetical protein
MYKVSTYSKIKPTSDRILQTIPGLITWFMITSPIWGVILFPIAYATFLLCYIIIWFLKSIRTLLFFAYSFYKIHHNIHVKWDTLYLKDNSRDKEYPTLHVRYGVFYRSCMRRIEGFE